jgi:hypothetical protein
MHQDDGSVIGALHFTYKPEQTRDVRGAVFIEAVESYQGIEEQEPRFKSGQSGFEALLISSKVKA